MLGNFGSRALDNGHDALLARNGRTPEPAAPPRPAIERPPVKSEPGAPVAAAPRTEPAAIKPETISCIGSGMSITGNIVCDGPMQVHGRIEGELRATEILVGDSAQVEGNIVAQDLTIRGRIKGTIRAVRVKLQGNGTVEGDIFHRSLSIEEHALFEGTSRRVENPIESAATPDARGSSSVQARGTVKPSLHAFGDISHDAPAA
jgi:cytoskeletal protein CcmA (bactofilin family)